MVETATGVPLRALIAMRRDAACVLDQPSAGFADLQLLFREGQGVLLSLRRQEVQPFANGSSATERFSSHVPIALV